MTARTPGLEIENYSFDEQLKEVGNNKPQFRLIVVNAKSASLLRRALRYSLARVSQGKATV